MIRSHRPALARTLAFACLAAILLGVALFRQRDGDTEPWVASGWTMGTYYTVKLRQSPDSSQESAIEALLTGTLDRVDALFSTYRADSEISRFNASESLDWFPLSPETAAVLAEAQQIARLSGGAFDVTVGPLVDLWKFGPTRDETWAVPDDAQIERVKLRVGHERFDVRLDPPGVRKHSADLQVDLSGIAKGYAVDCLAEALLAAGFADFLVDVGGEMQARGTGPKGPWRIGIETPDAGSRGVHSVIPISGSAIATSGDYRNYYESEGKRYSHLIDPRSGRPIEHRLASVSILDPSCTRADAWATALMVLGPEEGYEMAAAQGLPVLMIVKTADGFETRKTDSLTRLLDPP